MGRNSDLKYEYVEIIKCGTEVVTKIGNVRAIVTAAVIRFEKVQYEISYFTRDGDKKEVWCDEREFTDENKEQQRIGFKSKN